MGRSVWKVAALAISLLPGIAGAQSINIATGVSSAGVPLADLSTDPFWTVSIDGGHTFTAAKVLGDNQNVTCGCGILANALSGKWINATGLTPSSYPIGPTVYTRRTFDLSGYDLSTISMAGQFGVMDSNLGMYLNGHLLPGSTQLYPSVNPWQFLTAFSVNGASGWFNQGLNTLEFQTTTVNGVWDGVIVEQASVDGTLVTTAPEPASVLLLASGLAGLAVVARRRRRS